MKVRKGCAVVTGASSGIGEELAIQLASEGFPVVLVARRQQRLRDLASRIRLLFDMECTVIEADLEKRKECDKIFDQLKGQQISVFVNNAGFGDCGRFMDTDVNKELSMINVNVRAVHYLTKLALQKMKAQGGGYILNVASSAGLIPAGAYMATYYATKAYVASMTRAIAKELRDEGSSIYIGCLCPGPVNTEFNEVANVSFALSGIDARSCARYAVAQMKKKKVLIVPTLTMKMAVTMGRFLPQELLMELTARQQRKKLYRG